MEVEKFSMKSFKRYLAMLVAVVLVANIFTGVSLPAEATVEYDARMSIDAMNISCWTANKTIIYSNDYTATSYRGKYHNTIVCTYSDEEEAYVVTAKYEMGQNGDIDYTNVADNQIVIDATGSEAVVANQAAWDSIEVGSLIYLIGTDLEMKTVEDGAFAGIVNKESVVIPETSRFPIADIQTSIDIMYIDKLELQTSGCGGIYTYEFTEDFDIRSSIGFTGWAATPNGVSEYQYSFDSENFYKIEDAYIFERPDLINFAIPYETGHSTAGFTVKVPVGDLNEGTYELSIRLLDTQNGYFDLLKATVNVSDDYIYGDDGMIYKIEADNTATVVWYDGEETSVEIPGEIESHTIVSIAEYAFFACSELTDIVLPDSVTFIGENAFADKDLIIHGNKDSYAETYAAENGYKFIDLSAPTTDPIGLHIMTLEKTTYLVGEELDLTGFSFMASYSDGSMKEITDYTVSGFDSSVAGDCIVTVNWESESGKKYDAAFIVHVYELVGVSVVSTPDKCEYGLGDTLDLTGLIVTAKYQDGSAAAVTDYTVSGYNALESGIQTVTISYGDFEASFIVWVGMTLEGITVSGTAVGKVYNLGDMFDYSELDVTLNFSDGTAYDMDSDYELIGFESEDVGSKVVTVEYAGKSAEFTVTVVFSQTTSGDINNDGSIDVIDATHAYNVVLHNETANAYHKVTADVNKDGIVNILDVMALLNMI